MINFPIVPAGEEPETLPAFIIGKNGIYMRKASALGVSQTRVGRIEHLPDVQPELDYKLKPIPKKLSAQIAGFLLKVDKVFHAEGAVLLCLTKGRNWRIVIPRQDNTGGDVKYFIDPDTIPHGLTLAGTVHSHPFNKTSAPTASWTDESDERKIDGVHLVAGSLEHEPKYGAAVVIDGTRFKYLSWHELIVPAEADVDAVPDEWLDKIMKKKPGFLSSAVSKVTSYGGSYTYVDSVHPKEGETPEQAIARHNKSDLKWLAEDARKIGYRFKWTLEEILVSESDVEVSEAYATTGDVHQNVLVGTPPPVNGGTPLTPGATGVGPGGIGYTVLPDKVDQPGGPPWCNTSTPMAVKQKNHGTSGLCWYREGHTGHHSFETAPKVEPEHEQMRMDDDGGPPTVWRDATPLQCTEKHPGKPCPEKGCGCHCTNCKEHVVGAYDARDLSKPVPDDGEDLGCACTECTCTGWLVPGIDNMETRVCTPCEDGLHDWGMDRHEQSVGEDFGHDPVYVNRLGQQVEAAEAYKRAPPEDDECTCPKCWGGCYNLMQKGHKLCDACSRGEHYENLGKVADERRAKVDMGPGRRW